MVTIGMNYQVLPGKEETFETAFRNVVKAMQGIEGHTSSRLCRDIDSKQTYVILSSWQNRDSFDAFISSDAFKAVVNWGKEQILAARPEHTYYEH